MARLHKLRIVVVPSERAEDAVDAVAWEAIDAGDSHSCNRATRASPTVSAISISFEGIRDAWADCTARVAVTGSSASSVDRRAGPQAAP